MKQTSIFEESNSKQEIKMQPVLASFAKYVEINYSYQHCIAPFRSGTLLLLEITFHTKEPADDPDLINELRDLFANKN
jgi:hypothetical protein